MSTPRDFPTSVCARFADALPLYSSGELAPTEYSALRAHLASCPACRARLSGYAALDAAVRKTFSIPQIAAPFLSFDAIVSRTASAVAPQDVPPVAAPSRDAPDGTETATPIVAFSNWNRRRRVPTIQEVDVMSDLNDSLPPPVSTASRTAPHRHRARNVAAVAAVVALVALATAIFQGFGGAHSGNKSQVGNNMTPTKHTISAWQTVATFKNSGDASYSLFAVAQSDPRIVFKTGAGMSIQRSSDGGAHWATLSAPTQDTSSDPNASVTIMVDPLDANTVFAMVSGSDTNPKCPTPLPGMSIGAKILLSGGYSCNFEYVSTDGGNTWQALNLPGPGHVGDEIALSGPFQVQGGWLFSQLTPNLNGPAPLGYRLVKSSDGVNWQYADGALAAHSLVVTQFVVSARGGEIFAVSAPADGTNGDGKGDSSDLWHSTNAGASWTDIGPFTQAAQTNYTQLAEVTVNASNAVQLYSTAQAVSDGHQALSVSTDDGRTWQLAPTAGLPADLTHSQATPVNVPEAPGVRGPTLWPVGALADGSLVVMYTREYQIPIGTPQANGGGAFMISNSHVTYYALAPGANVWTALTPVLADGYMQAQWLAFDSAGKPTAIYTMQSVANANDTSNITMTLSRCALG